mmetsp:Transcript_94218/g.172581  ORF Transcript_94218/g.172581 Transcript_94218/m.172581 type:complete len:84 (-) Transcript_94218:32-283(-)
MMRRAIDQEFTTKHLSHQFSTAGGPHELLRMAEKNPMYSWTVSAQIWQRSAEAGTLWNPAVPAPARLLGSSHTEAGTLGGIGK